MATFRCSKYLACGLYLLLLMQALLKQEQVEGKTATRSSLVATSKMSLAGSPSEGDANSEDDNDFGIGANGKGNFSTLRRLKRDIFKGYDREVLPVADHQDHVDVEVDIAYRQVVDLDEKNQILKSLVWYRQYWTDAYLTWEPSKYDGLEKITIPMAKVWRPDLVLYEGVGTTDYENDLLPYAQLSYTGTIRYTQPKILETSCSVDTTFFPFDLQKCSFTFVSWTLSVVDLDLRSRRTSYPVKDESLRLFVNSGEWMLQNIAVHKQIADYAPPPHLLSNSSQSKSDNTKTTAADMEANPQSKMYIELPPDHNANVKEVRANLTELMYAEVKYTLVIKRNSSLYMQSMLFPSILLTTVALLGYFLPPDTGERVGLQITILLTFMVFLLTVGEMFPASTGPYIGIYFVLSMGQLGTNVIMSIVVLHLYFKPCVRDKSTWKTDRPRWYTMKGVAYEGDSLIPVRTRRMMQFFSRYFDIADTDALWMRPISNPDIMEGVQANGQHKFSLVKEDQDTYQTGDGDDDKVQSNMDRMTDSDTKDSEGRVPTPQRDQELVDVTIHNPREINRNTSDISIETKGSSRRKSSKIRDVHKIIQGLQINVKSMARNFTQRKEKDEDDEFEESIEKEQEEWKSVARAVDNLFFRLYIFIMFACYIPLIGVAIQRNLTLDFEL